jgi:hypothetical protein
MSETDAGIRSIVNVMSTSRSLPLQTHPTSDHLIEIGLDEGEKDMVVNNIHVDDDVATLNSEFAVPQSLLVAME